jgi:hypothetical protein
MNSRALHAANRKQCGRPGARGRQSLLPFGSCSLCFLSVAPNAISAVAGAGVWTQPEVRTGFLDTFSYKRRIPMVSSSFVILCKQVLRQFPYIISGV